MSSTTKLEANASLAIPTRLLHNYLEEAAAKLAQRREIVGDRIREAREHKGMLQKELARRVHVEPQTVSNWERGVTAPDLDKLELLGRELDREVAYFLIAPETAAAQTDQLQEVLRQVEATRDEVRGLRTLVEELLEGLAQAS